MGFLGGDRQGPLGRGGCGIREAWRGREHFARFLRLVTDAIALRETVDSERAFLVTRKLRVFADECEWPSARVAGAIARTDREVGWWRSPSNRPIRGVGGLTRTVDWSLDDPSSSAHHLNANQVATVIHDRRFGPWADPTCSSDERWQFLSVARIRDQIDEALVRGHL